MARYLQDTDISQGTLTYNILNPPYGSSFNPATRTFTWTPSYAQGEDYNGVYYPLFRVQDGATPALSDFETVTINVNHIIGTIPTNAGNHPIGLAGNPSTIATASALLQEIQNQGADCPSLQRWDGSGWRTYYRGLPFGDFNLISSQGYTLNCRNSATAGVNLPYSPAASVTYNLNPGFNYLNMPLATAYTSESFLASLDAQGAAPFSIMHIDASGNFITHYYSTNENIFGLEQGVPYVVRSNATATVTLT